MKTSQLYSQTESEKKPLSLYEAGVSGGIDTPSSLLKDVVSPVTTPEFENFRQEIIGSKLFGVETQEQKEKRERQEAIQRGLTGFTDGLSALANLYYTTKGAPSQKQEYQMPALERQLYQDRVDRDKKLENLRAWQRQMAQEGRARDWQKKMLDMNRKYAEDAERRAEQRAIAQEERAFGRQKAMLDLNRKNTEEAEERQFGRKKELMELENKYRMQQQAAADGASSRKAEEDFKREKELIRLRSGSSAGARTIRVPNPDGGYTEYNENDLKNPMTLAYVYNQLPDAVKPREADITKARREGDEWVYPVKEFPTKDEMMVAIGRSLSDGYITEVAPEIARSINREQQIARKDTTSMGNGGYDPSRYIVGQLGDNGVLSPVKTNK